MSDRILEVEGLGVAYGAVAAVRDISFSVGRGEVVSIIGTNGAGKSSTLKAIIGMVRPSSGRIMFGDDRRNIAGSAPHKVVRQGIALVPEGRRMLSDMTVEENLAIGALAARGRATPKSNDEIFELFPRLEERRTALAGNLSGGEQQMLAVARALISQPVLVLMDEPSLGLAASVAKGVYELVGQLNRSGVSVLLVDQNVPLALQVSARYYVMRSGSIVGEGASSDGERQLDRLPALMGIVQGAGRA